MDMRDNCRSPIATNMLTAISGTLRHSAADNLLLDLFMSTTSLNRFGYEDRGLTQEHSGCFLRKGKGGSASIKLG